MIADERKSPAGKLNPDLVTASGVQPNADQSMISGFQHPILQSCFFDAVSLTVNDIDPVSYTHLTLPTMAVV